MALRTSICDLLGLEFPLFGFSNSPAVCAAISNAGGMGVLGALPYSAEQLQQHLTWLDQHTGGRPYGVDVVIPASFAGAGGDRQTLAELIPAGHRRFIADLLQRYQVPPLPDGVRPPEELIGWTPRTAGPQVEVALAHPIKLLVNALGPLPAEVVQQAHRSGVRCAGLSGSVEHARKQVAAGADLVVAQGWEAGGHTGEVATMVLVPEVVDAVAPVPVLAAGGIGCGRQMAAALALGAQGAWTGSIWLLASENEFVRPAVRQKLLRASARDTVRSRALSGKPARQLRTAWTEAWDGPGSPGPLPLPLQYMATAEAHARIHYYAGDPATRAAELQGSPVGQVVGRMAEVRPAAQIFRDLIDECRAVLLGLSS